MVSVNTFDKSATLRNTNVPHLFHHACVVYCGKIYISGGLDKNYKPSGIVYEYDADDAKTIVHSQIAPRYRHAMVVLHGKMYIIGGMKDEETVYKQVLVLQNKEWIECQVPTEFQFGLYAKYVATDSCIYECGGVPAKQHIVAAKDMLSIHELNKLPQELMLHVLKMLPYSCLNLLMLVNKNQPFCKLATRTYYFGDVTRKDNMLWANFVAEQWKQTKFAVPNAKVECIRDDYLQSIANRQVQNSKDKFGTYLEMTLHGKTGEGYLKGVPAKYKALQIDMTAPADYQAPALKIVLNGDGSVGKCERLHINSK